MFDSYNSLPDFLKVNENVVFRFWVYRRVYTPYEEKNAFSDESIFESSHANFGVIRECISIGGGDFLLGIQLVYDEDFDVDNPEYDQLEYYKLSEIRLGYHRDDQPPETEESIISKCDEQGI